ncbi:MAG: class I SAM-dependent methyltransferase [Proteobacteria bacterium]|nr:class I SAM-dependent methyltransferase [Pseudomonadota bacterium]
MLEREYATLYRVEDEHWWYRQLRRVLHWHLTRFLPDWHDAAILDAGCGTGGNLAHLAGSGRRVGLDFSPDALAGARRRNLAQLVRGTVTSLPFAAGSFDAAISMSVIYHQWVADPADALREMHRVLRPGGLLFLDVPAYQSLLSAHDEAVMTARRFDAPGVRRLVEASGFEVLRITHWNTLLFPAIWAARRMKLMPAGQDFETTAPTASGRNALLDLAMRFEAALLKRMPLPFGVSIHCVARRVESV